MTLARWLQELLPASTARAWPLVAEVAPMSAYLVGGTAIAVHLHHRESRDLDLFTAEAFDVAGLAKRLSDAGRFVATDECDGTLNGVLDDCKVQFLDASQHRIIDRLTVIEGMPVAGLGDLVAMKLKVIGDRGELRDYFDLIELEKAGYRMEEGLGLFLDRYQPTVPGQAVAHLIKSLGYLGDVVDDPGLPVSRKSIEAYWRLRQPEVAVNVDRRGVPQPRLGQLDRDRTRRRLLESRARGSTKNEPSGLEPDP